MPGAQQKRKRSPTGEEVLPKRRKLEQMTLTQNKIRDPDSGKEEGTWKWSLERKATPRKDQENTDSPLRRSSRARRSAVEQEDPAVTKFFKKHKKELEDVTSPQESRVEEWTPEIAAARKKGRRGKSEEEDSPPGSPVRTVKKESVDSDDEENMELKRQRNLEDNAKFLASLGIHTEVSKYGGLTKPKVNRPQSIKKREPKERLPRRASLRIQRITPDGATLPEPPPQLWDIEPEHPRKPSGTIAMGEYVWQNTSDEDVLHLAEEMGKLASEKPTDIALNMTPHDQHIKQLSKLQLVDFVKAVPNRIFSVGFHPSETKLMAVAGDKWGHLAFWDLARGEEGMSTFTPHSRPVNHIVSPYHDHSRVYTASYDGTLRATHLETATFEEVYAKEEDDDVRLTRFDLLSPSSLIVSQGDGCVAVVDTRTSSTTHESLYQVHDRLVKCVNVHPVDKHYFLTATNGGDVNLWDLRKVNKKKPECVDTMPHAKSVDAAHFSPVNGHRILTTCYDNTLSIYDSSNMANIPKLRTIRHNNQTGRWLSNFRAEWHPQREDLFVIGSMNHPRQIELYSTEGRVVHTYQDLTSVCSLNAFHPTVNALVGANSSGRLVAYR